MTQCLRPLCFLPRWSRSKRLRAAILCHVFGAILPFVEVAVAQPTVPELDSPAVSNDNERSDSNEPLDLEHGRRLLSAVRDHVFSFDDPAFYWYCRFVRADADLDRYRPRTDETPALWRNLLERPSDYRGDLLFLRGEVLRTHGFDVPNRPGVGRLFQVELAEKGSRSVTTVILTDDPGEVPVGSRVSVRGFFIKVRSFQTVGGSNGTGALVISKYLNVEDDRSGGEVSGPPISSDDLLRWLAGTTGALFIIWIVLRRFTRSADSGETGLARNRTSEAAEDDFAWLEDPTAHTGKRKDE
ncbi:MAG: hypothetical protein KF841_00505 [Phycisphaerae bacterium]|nr:hypothetical protein [Phycisphaerae bacterium]